MASWVFYLCLAQSGCEIIVVGWNYGGRYADAHVPVYAIFLMADFFCLWCHRLGQGNTATQTLTVLLRWYLRTLMQM